MASEVFSERYELVRHIARGGMAQVYLAQDPNASIRSRRVAFSAGHGFEVITTLVRRAGSRSYPLSILSYVFLHGGDSYEFVYYTSTPRAGLYFPVFNESARSIRFT